MLRQSITAQEGAALSVDPAKVKILAAAEALFARESIDSVSLREIALKAGHRNVAAVQYHFGDRQGLLQAIFAWRVNLMEEPRRRLLAELDAKGTPDDLAGLIRALCEPILDLVDDEGVHTYASFMCQYLMRLRPTGVQHASDLLPRMAVSLNEIQNRLFRLIVGGDIMEGDQRIGLAYLIVMNAIVFADTEKLPVKDPARFRARFDEAVRMAAAALAASMD